MATFLQKGMLFKGLLSGEKAYTGPFHAMIDITRRCNLKCVGCRFHSPEALKSSPSDSRVQDMPRDLFEKICRQLCDAGTRVLFLMGEGEPLLHPDLFRMIAFAKELGFHITVISNGTLVNEALAGKLSRTGVDGLQISLWALAEEDYAGQYPGTNPENYQRVLQGLRLLASEKRKTNSRLPRLVLHHPINHRNLSRLETIADLACQTGCDGVSLSPFLSFQGCNSELDLSPEEERQLILRLGNLKRVLRGRGLEENIDIVLKRYTYVPLRRKTAACYAGWFHTRIQVDGTIVPCGFWPTKMGSMETQSFADIWNGPASREFRRCLRTHTGLKEFNAKDGKCTYCCFAWDNIRIERWVRGWYGFWLRHFV